MAIRRDAVDKAGGAAQVARMTFLYVAIGGALGAVLRYLTALTVPFPLGTLTVNLVGSLAMGVVFVVLLAKGLDKWQPLVMTGVLGGFTTFSAFSLDTLRLYEAGQLGGAAAYVLGSVIGAVVACFLGVALARGIFL